MSQTDGHRLLKEEMAALLTKDRRPEDVQRMFKNDERLDAVVVLVREAMLDAAEPLLAKIDVASPGRIAAVTGNLRASQGRCDEATALLTQAKGEGRLCCDIDSREPVYLIGFLENISNTLSSIPLGFENLRSALLHIAHK